MPRVSLAFDYFNLDVKDLLHQRPDARDDPQRPGTSSATWSRAAPVQPQFPGLPGRITQIDQRFINLGDVKIEGCDINIKADSAPTTDGAASRSTSTARTTRKYDVQQIDGTFAGFVSNALERRGVRASRRATSSTRRSRWTRGPWSATLGNSVPELVHRRAGTRRTTATIRAASARCRLWDLYGVVHRLQELEAHAGRAEPVRQGSAVHATSRTRSRWATTRRTTMRARASCTAR